MVDESAFTDAAQRADLASGVVLNPGLQIVGSTDDPGKLEIIARVCSSGLSREQLIDAANAIAVALYGSPDVDDITLLLVSSWVPSGEYLDRDPGVDVVQTDYELYLWDADVSLDGHWQ
ncbi:hypothetical protein LJR045_001005 [Microbacterium sp. LjRoot45]|uniref:hypothetical protein n=1 Tax=Microbacterium sp. LjRoot45 TaxID=3342329 RepID=UPI003ED0E237